MFPDLPPEPLEIRMSRTSPGRYALHEFAKNVYDVRITNGAGAALTAERPDLHQWTVANHDGTVRFEYTLFADRRDGTYAAVGPDGAMLNAPASLVWARGLESRGAQVTFELPAGRDWSVATQLAPTEDPVSFVAPDLAYLLDSPMLVGDLDVRSWTESTGARTDTIRLALAHLGSDAAADEFEDMVAAVVRESTAVFGELPEFDYGTYTFLSSYLPWASGDGMEHRNSTVLTNSGRLPDNAVRLLGTVAHEFFHAWSIERIRPATLEPFDFEAANVSRELWFGEGFTSYYDDLILTRIGVVDEAGFGQRMTGLINTVVNSPGRRLRSPVEMSMQAPFVDAAVSVDPQNRGNTFISYYTWGAAVGLAMDLSIRTTYPGATLDDVMRRMWEVHGKPFRPYTVADVESALARVTSPEFAETFFDAYVRGREVPDYEELLRAAGYVLAPARPDRAVLAFEGLDFTAEGARVTGYPSVWSPLYEAGISRNDRILTVDGREIRSATDLRRALDGKRVGDVVSVRFRGRLGQSEVDVTLGQDPAWTVTLDAAASEDAVDFRRVWLGSALP